jgi:hypothetical protein
MPDDSLRYTGSPGLSCAADAPKHAALAHASGYKPRIDRAFNPVRNRHRADMSALAKQIHDGPMVLSSLKVGDLQFSSLFPPQTAAQENAEKGPISLAFERAGIRHLAERLCLIDGEPVSQTNTEVLRPFDSADAGREIRAEQAGISSLVRKPADGRQPAVNRAGAS